MDTTGQRPEDILAQVFGFSAFRGEQGEICNQVINGGDALVLMPTGGGKSLCYQLPALAREGMALVVSPLIALMADQVDALRELGVAANYLNSSMDEPESAKVQQEIIEGKIKLLYVAPERLFTSRFGELLSQVKLSLIAIDEAHCISKWGHDFRPEYLKLEGLARQFPEVPRIALTATADQSTQEEIQTKLGLENARKFTSSFDRPNLHYKIILKNTPKRQLLKFILNDHLGDSGIVYCLSRKRVDETAAWLRKEGVKALPYHAGLPAEERAKNHRRFTKEESVVMVATIAFGMGVDKPDIRFVAHMDLPKNMEAYYQETGRAGRDSMPADCLLLYGLSDLIFQQQFFQNPDSPPEIQQAEIERRLAFWKFLESPVCRRVGILGYFNEEYAGPCGHCDHCDSPIPHLENSVQLAQKALSNVFRTGQLFGAAHLAQVLVGDSNDKISRAGHHKVSTFGVGKELNQNQWKSVYRQLLTQGFLTVEENGSWKLLPPAKDILNGKQTLELMARYEEDKQKQKFQTSKTPKARADFSKPDSAELFDQLRTLRRDIAKQKDVPNYIIFADKSLWEMSEYRPSSLIELGRIYGVGEVKLEHYGEDFLEVINQFGA